MKNIAAQMVNFDRAQMRRNAINMPAQYAYCLVYTSPSPRPRTCSRMPSSA
ncbi:hypothetical protein C2W44_27005, partial [Escherichia coli]